MQISQPENKPRNPAPIRVDRPPVRLYYSRAGRNGVWPVLGAHNDKENGT